MTAAVESKINGDISRLAMKKILHSKWLLFDNYERRTKEMTVKTKPFDEKKRSDARCELLMTMKARREKQLDELEGTTSRLKELGIEMNPDVLERALILPEQRLRETGSFPSVSVIM